MEENKPVEETKSEAPAGTDPAKPDVINLSHGNIQTIQVQLINNLVQNTNRMVMQLEKLTALLQKEK